MVFLWDQASVASFLKQVQVFYPQAMLATLHDGQSWIAQPELSQHIRKLIYPEFIVAETTFSDRFEKRFGYKPILTASNAYDALNATLTALASGAVTAQELREKILTTEIDSATFGRFKFTSTAQVPSKVEIREYKSPS